MASQPNALLHSSLSNYRRPSSRSVDPPPQQLIPDRWSPTGWKYVNPDHKPAFFNRRYARDLLRQSQQTVSSSPSYFRTTNQSSYPSPSPDQYHSKASSYKANPFPPLPSDRQFIDSVLGCSVKRSPSLSSQRDWATQWASRRAFHKKRHVETEWIRMYLSSGTIK